MVLLWRDILEAFIALRERNLVTGAEAILLDDFMTYVEDYFPSLGPFRTLALCGRDHGRMTRRLRQLLGEVAGCEPVVIDYGPFVKLSSDLVSHVFLRVADDEEGIELSFSPALTLTQARNFYQRHEVVSAIKELARRQEWYARPNFHFGYRSFSFKTSGPIELDEYIDLWEQRITDGEGEVPAKDWGSYWEELVALGVVDPDDRSRFNRDFSNRPSATPQPGLVVRRRWPIAEAEALDSQGRFTNEVQEALSQVLAACNCSVDSASTSVA